MTISHEAIPIIRSWFCDEALPVVKKKPEDKPKTLEEGVNKRIGELSQAFEKLAEPKQKPTKRHCEK
jgi:hypothetical protein